MAIASDTRTVVGVFNSVSDAQSAVRELESQGILRDDISLVANKNATGYDTMDPVDRDKASDVVADAGIGAAIGGVGGLLLAAAGAITLPVIGPILAAGPIVAALTGAGIGAATGGLIGALTESGIPETHAQHYAEGVRRGDVLVTVKAVGEKAEMASRILDQHNAIDVEDRVQDWQSRGWSGYSPDATPYTDEELRSERSRYTAGTLTGLSGIGVDRARAGNDMGDSLKEGASRTEVNLREAGRDLNDATSSSNPGQPGRGDLGDRTKDAAAEAGRDLKELGKDANDLLHGRTDKQPHDYQEEKREGERERRRSRVYDRS
ncbi:MAG: hypothetical protein H7Y20_10630 [Bryobacteraceae bacterium]|nr:hypothetical protein [Bryobacteraceae bacterium]